jgi:hypothetical protein
MPIFISYSHSDKEIVNLIATHLVKHNANVWVDTWELNVGDSILSKVQDAIQESSALLVVLSKASVESEWCKKELNAGLMRELDEKKVRILPVLVEDCDIPLFLREKIYADLRKDFDEGINSIRDAIGKITNADQGRIYKDAGYSDFAVDWGFDNDSFHLRYTIIHLSNKAPVSILTEINVFCNAVVTKRYLEYVDAGLGWLGRAVVAEALFDFGEQHNCKVILEDSMPQEIKAKIQDTKLGAEHKVIITCRRLGEDNGKNQLINISAYLKEIRNYVRNISREPTSEEKERYIKLISRPFPT